MNPLTIFHPTSPSAPWPPVVVYETSEEERLIKSIAPLGQGEGERHWYWPPPVRSLTSTCGPDGCSGQLLQSQTKKGAELRLSTVCIHTLLLLILFVCQSTCEYFVYIGLSVLNKSRRKREKGERLKEEVWETIGGLMMKRNPSPAESQPLVTQHWRNEPTVQYHNGTTENRKRTKQRKKWLLDTIKKNSEEWFQFALA